VNAAWRSTQTNWTELFVGPVSAAAVVSVTFWLSPAKKKLSGMITLLIGAAFAWLLLHDSCYPELHPPGLSAHAVIFLGDYCWWSRWLYTLLVHLAP
jgi:hypothetical protein